uniref:N-alpha-acetyltransferase 40 n=1 Tax=Strigamia maritima TaxID=126957 RepID=T1IYE8_STRMM
MFAVFELKNNSCENDCASASLRIPPRCSSWTEVKVIGLLIEGFIRLIVLVKNYPFATAQILVEAANKRPNHLNQLTAFKKYTQCGQNLLISCHRVTELSRNTISWALALTRENMHTLSYEQSEWGWSEKVKLEELTNKKAWYLIVRTPDGQNVAFVHFRFDLDYGIEVLYCYEIQLNESVRRVGLGQYLMLILELIAKQNRMKKVMLTVFKHNVVGRSFFAKKLRYEVDETSPSCRRTSYEILSKKMIYRTEQSRTKQLSHQAAASCLRIRMHYSLDNYRRNPTTPPEPELPASTAASVRDIAPKIKAFITHTTTSAEHSKTQSPKIIDHSTAISEPNLDYNPPNSNSNSTCDVSNEPNLQFAQLESRDNDETCLREPDLDAGADTDKMDSQTLTEEMQNDEKNEKNEKN